MRKAGQGCYPQPRFLAQGCRFRHRRLQARSSFPQQDYRCWHRQAEGWPARFRNQKQASSRALQG